MEELRHFDLRGGLKTPNMDAIPHNMGIGPWSYCVQKLMNISFGGTLTALEDDIMALYSWMLVYGGLGHHFISH
jgi:hypothetical protein